MIIKVTGFFQNPQTNLIYLDPQLIVEHRIGYPGVSIIDVNIVSQETPTDSIRYYPQPELDIDTQDMIVYQACEYVIQKVIEYTHINRECKYNIEK